MQIFKPAAAPHRRDIACLTSMRFFAAAWVLALHYTDYVSYSFAENTGFFDSGKLGVDFFFILSGFILTHVYLDGLENGRFSLPRFVQKRLARLYPLHVVTFLVVLGYVIGGTYLGVGFQSPESYTASAALPNLLLLHAWGVQDHMSWNYVSWSISAEWFAYLTFLPLSLLIIRAPGSSLTKLVAAVAFLGLCYLVSPWLVGRPLTYLTHDFGILRILPEFTLGIVLYHVSRQWDVSAKTGLALLLGTVATLILLVHFGGSDLIAVLLLGLIILTAASLERQDALPLLGNRVLIYLGETSYSLYMTHAIVFIVYFKVLKLALGDAHESWIHVLGPVAIPAAFAAASLGYHLVEMPARAALSRPFNAARLLRGQRTARVG